MAGVRKIKSKALRAAVPQSREECTEFIARIGRLQRERKRIETEMNDELSAIRQKYEEMARPMAEEIRQLCVGVQVWCEANRASLTNNGKVKHANLASGEVRWRMRPPRVSLRGKENIIETFKKLGWTQFVRVKEDVNKDAVLADPERATKVPGVKVIQTEDFVIVPFETELEEVA